MRVVLIHGRAAAMDIPEIMARDWEAALRFGLQRGGSKVPAGEVDVRFAFYGSVWRPDERQPLPAIDFGPAAPQLGLPGLGDLSLWVDQHLGLGETLLDLLLRDLDEYYAEPELRKLTNDRLVERLSRRASRRASASSWSPSAWARSSPTTPCAPTRRCRSAPWSPAGRRSRCPRSTAGWRPPPRAACGRARPSPASCGSGSTRGPRTTPRPPGTTTWPPASRRPTRMPSTSRTSRRGVGRQRRRHPQGLTTPLDYLSSRVVGTAVDAALRVL